MRTKRFTCTIRRKDSDLVVKNGLAVTPQTMLEMTQRGIPVTTSNAAVMSQFGDESPDMEIPLDRLRGVDPATMWTESRVIKEKAAEAYKSHKFNQKMKK